MTCAGYYNGFYTCSSFRPTFGPSQHFLQQPRQTLPGACAATIVIHARAVQQFPGSHQAVSLWDCSGLAKRDQQVLCCSPAHYFARPLSGTQSLQTLIAARRACGLCSSNFRDSFPRFTAWLRCCLACRRPFCPPTQH